METIKIGDTTWLKDERNNRVSITPYRDEAEARNMLESLSYCSYCSNCSDCSNCSECSNCSNCSDCSRCSSMAPQKVEVPAIPVIEDIHRKVYEAVQVPGALNMKDWHTCETTHCRAGWVVHLAGEAGYELENKTSATFAAMQIYKASGYPINPCRFFDSNEEAMADMKRLAEACP